MRKLYIFFPIATTLSSQLSWSHYLELLKVEEKVKRDFYMKECIESRWSVRELQRQKNSLLYERLTLSTNKKEVLRLSREGKILGDVKDFIKDPFVLEFLDIKENTNYLENDLEKNILNHLKEFLLELGKGFSFIGNQVRITIGEAEGHNWWCVMYPPLCIPAAENVEGDTDTAEDYFKADQVDMMEHPEDYEIRFKCLDVFKKIKNKLKF